MTTSPCGPINAGTELPISPFVSGAYLDASFGLDWSQPQRTDVRDGDLRVLLAKVKGGDGKPNRSQFVPSIPPRTVTETLQEKGLESQLKGLRSKGKESFRSFLRDLNRSVKNDGMKKPHRPAKPPKRGR